MFTGIITQIGSVRAVRRSADGMALTIACAYPALVLGESIAVDGVCLTARRVEPDCFEADLSAETLARSTLGATVIGARVNLERALAVGDRLGGHIVAGHVDGIGRVLAREPVGDAQRWCFDAPPEVQRFVAPKGSIAIDGVSLTVNALGPTTFEVMLVPFTLGATTLGARRVGEAVNLEVDVLARYVARALDVRDEPGHTGVTAELLARAGFKGP